MLADIGTNGEMVLSADGIDFACSTAAGPAFEGAGIEMGMRAMDGAIDRVTLVNGKLFAHVIGQKEAVGICGSGLIDAVSCLLKTEEIEDSGYLEDDAVIDGSVRLTPKDVRAVQLAKSAVRAGIETLLARCKKTASQLDKIYIAGGFGSYLDIDSVITIGLLPRVDKNKVEFLGNAALGGAAAMLLDKTLTQSRRKLQVIELANDPDFTQNYMDCMFF